MNVYYHYIKDHLGNICAVVNSAADTLVQSTIYYPSGVPMAHNLGQDVAPSYYNAIGLQYTKNFGREEQPYLYNGKEFIEAHGLNEYDSQARMYYAPIMRTTTMDPHAENRYHISPYVWCRNNPINCIDPNGEDDIFSELGVYLRHIDNGTNYVMVEDANRELQNITTFSYAENKVAHRAMLKNIGTYYAQKIELNKELGIYDSSQKTGFCTKLETCDVYWSIVDGGISNIYEESMNIMNSLAHEKYHVEDGQSGYTAEVAAIISQINHPTWSNTTQSHKQTTMKYLITNIQSAIKEEGFEKMRIMVTPYLQIINEVVPMSFDNGEFYYGDFPPLNLDEIEVKPK